MICPLMTCVVMMGKVFTEDVMEESKKHDLSISPKIMVVCQEGNCALWSDSWRKCSLGRKFG